MKYASKVFIILCILGLARTKSCLVDKCFLCKHEEENFEHVLFRCENVEAIWDSAPFNISVPPSGMC